MIESEYVQKRSIEDKPCACVNPTALLQVAHWQPRLYRLEDGRYSHRGRLTRRWILAHRESRDGRKELHPRREGDHIECSRLLVYRSSGRTWLILVDDSGQGKNEGRG